MMQALKLNSYWSCGWENMTFIRRNADTIKEKKNIYSTISHYGSITRNTCTEFRFHTTLNFIPAVIRRYTYDITKFIKLH